MKKRIYAILLITVITVLLAGCWGKNSDKTEQITEDKNQPSKEVEEKKLFVTPFSGELVEDEVTMRPVLVTINNHPYARPQSGLASADVVYEMLSEGDITRFLALYQSEIPSNIGPVRSARSYFIEIAEGLDAFYIAHGYSPEAKTMLFNGEVDNINGMQYDGTIFKRSSDRKAPHNSYISGENIPLAADKVNTSLLYKKKVSYTYYGEDETILTGIPANQIDVTYSRNNQYNSHYIFDPVRKTYSRSSNNVVTTDALTGEPVEISNILIFEMEHAIIDDAGRREINIFSGGKAYVFQNGVKREVIWENRDGVLKAIEIDGTEVKLVPGMTWIHIVPTQPGISTSVKYS